MTQRDLSIDCIHLGEAKVKTDEDGNIRGCRGCWVFECAVHGTCAITYKRKDAAGHCLKCEQYECPKPPTPTP